MTAGRITVSVILLVTIAFGIGLWWANTRAYYEPIELGTLQISLADAETITLVLDTAEAIDAETSPLRFRACFGIAPDLVARLAERGEPYIDPTPLTTPAWFDCFDAAAIGAALEAGDATAYYSERNITLGVDRVVALYPDGRGFAWNQLNDTLE